MNRDNSVLIVEDELITANSISGLLEEEGFFVVGVVDDSSEAFLFFDGDKEFPKTVLCDINIKGELNGIELAKQLKSKYGCEIIFLTAYADNKTLYDAFGAEPVMYIVKPFTDKQLLSALHMATYRIMKALDDDNGKIEIILTKREREIIELVMQGFTSRQIAAQLFISPQTVKTHRRSMLQRNNMHSFSQLVYQLHK